MKKLFNFLLVQTLVFLFAYVMTWSKGGHFLPSLCCDVVSHYVIMGMARSTLKENMDIHGEARRKPTEQFVGEFHLYHLINSFIVSSLWFYLLKHQSHSMPSVGTAIVQFFLYVPFRFYFEVVFDFCHYWIHRGLHHPRLYQYLHKTHHKFLYPSMLTTFYMHPLDIILTLVIPLTIAYHTTPSMPIFVWNVVMTDNVYIEMVGHVGKMVNGNDYLSIYSWIPYYHQIRLMPMDHDLHHSRNQCNYSKRFRLWDRVFGTYVDPERLVDNI
jgi:sterol desaturase/sphingolipid hydroxylase (fatty acid hydroxylase superfamily)